jgi:hypothetical protein
MKTFTKLLGIIAIGAVIASTLAGCASTPKEPTGTLTIAGIPEEYEGKFVNSPPDTSYIPVTNGEVTIPLFIEPSKAANVGFYIYNASGENVQLGASPLCVAFFNSVTLENGSMNWTDAALAGCITITGIPDTYNDDPKVLGSGVGHTRGQSFVHVGYSPSIVSADKSSILGGLIGSSLDSDNSEASSRWYVNNGTLRVWVFGKDESGNYQSYTASGAKDIMVSLDTGEKDKKSDFASVSIMHDFLFKDAQVTDGKATLNFKTGVLQK